MPLLDYELIPHFGWKVNLDHAFTKINTPYSIPRIKQIIYLLPLLIRYFIYNVLCYVRGRIPVMDFIKIVKAKQMYGVPFGGIGSGSIGRGFKGEFCRFQMIPGLYDYDVAIANQFIVTIQNSTRKTVYQKVLSCTGKPAGKELSSWDWNFPGHLASYTGLYPRSWTQFNIPEQDVMLTCRQVSPVIPHNYKDSCFPGGVFIWYAENNSGAEKYITVTFTLGNECGNSNYIEGPCQASSFTSKFKDLSLRGASIKQNFKHLDCTFSIAALEKRDSSVSLTTDYNPVGPGSIVWHALQEEGTLAILPQDENTNEKVGVAVAVQMKMKPKSSNSAEFAFVWHMPEISFLNGGKKYRRYYTKHFGDEKVNGTSLCAYALENYSNWEQEIYKWQKPILNDVSLPSWYKSAIFNELYYISDGGTQWLLMDNESDLLPNDVRRNYGRFGYLEGHEYKMYNTYDVHFYASWALIQLWPHLQESIQYEFRDTIDYESPEQRKHFYDGQWSTRKKKHTIPHDLGEPGDDPWLRINAYPVHDVSEWRDLNSKFVLQCYRDYSITNNVNYLKDMWPQLNTIMDYSLKWDTDDDGMIENGGFPDQTYDAWTMTGVSAYCGSLWFAACYAMYKMARQVGSPQLMDKYSDLFTKASQVFIDKLWNGQYYNFDCSKAPRCRSVMADQLCGLWYLKASGIKDEILPNDQVKSALQTIYNLNVKSFEGGSMGAVNGMLPSGMVDDFAIQSEEVWTGVTYSLAALFIHEKMKSEGFNTAAGIYKTGYYTTGLAFQTPEAFYQNKKYRSLGYMRPLCIWAMNRALELS